MKKMYTRLAALLPIFFFFFFVAALQAQTYQPVVTEGGLNCSAEATYDYDSDYNGKPSFSAYEGDLVIRWEADNQWHIRTYGDDAYQNNADTPLPPCDGWTGCSGADDVSLTGGCSSPNPPGAALHFDGTNDYVYVSNDAPYQLNSGTVEAWIRPVSAGGYRGIVVKGLAFGIFLADDVLTAYDWANNVATSGGGSLADGNWHHVAFVFQNGVANGSKLYVDGSVVQTFTYNISNHSEALAIGAGGSGGGYQLFGGDMDEVRIWNSVRSDCEIAAYNNCEIDPATPGLLASYHFNQGTAGGDNTAIPNLTNAVAGGVNGTFGNFALTGSTSNFIEPGAVTSGIACGNATVAFNVTGGGTFCPGSTGAHIGLSGSETGVDYQLKKDGVYVGSSLTGTGSALDFGSFSEAGTYTVVGSCLLDMTSSAILTAETPEFTVPSANPANVCSGAPSNLSASASAGTIDWYDAATGGTLLGSSAPGANFPVSPTATTTYYAQINSGGASGCFSTDRVPVTVSVSPLLYGVTGGGVFCTGSTDLPIGLSGSQTGVRYQLKKDNVDEGSPLAGTGDALEFAINAAGTYTVVATFTAGSCTETMAGSAAFTEATPPIATISSANLVVDEPLTVSLNSGTISKIEWKNNGTTVFAEPFLFEEFGVVVAGGNGYGGDPNELAAPYGIFVDAYGNLFVAESGYDGRVTKWAPGATQGVVVATGCTGARDVFVDNYGNVYVAEMENYRVTKWAPGATSGVVVAGGNGGVTVGVAALNQIRPTSIWVDTNGDIYVSDFGQYRVMKWAAGATEGTIVAGGNDNGNAFNQLGALTAIWLDADKNIYIVDGNNSRVVKWAPGATTGILVAGGIGFGTGLDKLNSPRDIFVDAAGNMLVADYANHRVVKWTPGATAGILVAGIGGQGSGLNQLDYPEGVAVGPNGDLYVGEPFSDRVLKFNGIVENTYTPTVCGEWTAFVTDNNGCTDLSNDLDLISRWYADADGDGFKDPNNFIDACQPSGFLPSSAINDCDDTNPLINPGADEICGDGIDNDCDGVAQNSTSSFQAPVIDPVTGLYCPGTTVTLTATSLTGLIEWYDTPSGGMPVGAGSPFEYTVAAPTVYAQENSYQYSSMASIDMLPGLAVVNSDPLTGDDGRGLAVTRDYVFYTGDDKTVRYDHNLQNGFKFPIRLDGMFSDLHTGKLYGFQNATGWSSSNFDRFQEYSHEGVPIGAPVMLSQAFSDLPDQTMICSGFGYVLVNTYSTSSTPSGFFRIDLPSGQVTLITSAYYPTGHVKAESNWSWYTVEYDGTDYSIVYFKNSTLDIQRLNVTTGQIDILVDLNPLNLGFGDNQNGQLVFSPWDERLFFHEENGNIYNSNQGGEWLMAVHASNTVQCSGAPRSSVTITAPTRFYVDIDATGNNDGSSWTDAFNDPQDAIDNACEGVEIWVAEGTYLPERDPFGNANPTDPRDKTFYLKDGVAIYGGFAGTETLRTERDPAANVTILSGDIGTPNDPADNCYHVAITINDGPNTVLDGFTITKGTTASSYSFEFVEGFRVSRASGAGLHLLESAITLNDCIFEGNGGVYGGGLYIYMYEVAPVISRCRFTNNKGIGSDPEGSGMYLYADGNAEISFTDCEFSSNTGGVYGGAAYLYLDASAHNINFIGCTFTGNAANNGGAMYTYISGTNQIGFTNCTFTGNTATLGGAVYQDEGTNSDAFTFTNCLFVGNQSTDKGGALYLNAGISTIINSTFYGNSTTSTTENSGAIYAPNGLAIVNSILWNNTSAAGGPTHQMDFGSATPNVTYSTVQGTPLFAGTGNINADPLFTDAANDDYTLQGCSPAINAGNNAAISLPTDLAGDARIQNTTVDMGAYENVRSSGIITAIEVANASDCDGQNTTCTTDDTFTADVTVTFTSIPTSGNLSLTGPTIVGSVPPVDVADIDVSAANSISVSGFNDPNDNGMYVPDGTAGGATRYTNGVCELKFDGFNWSFVRLGASPMTLAIQNFGNATTVPCSGWYSFGNGTPTLTGACGGNTSPLSHTFTGVKMLADGGDIDLTATFSEGCDYTDDEVDTAPTCSGGSVYTLSVVNNTSSNTAVASTFTPEADLYNNAPQWSGLAGFFLNIMQRIRWEASNSRWEVVELPAGTVRQFNTTGDTENLPCTGWQSNAGPALTLSGGCGPLTSSGGGPDCDITDISITNASACNDNGTTDASDDYFTANVTVTFAYAPAGQTLVLTDASGAVLATKEVDDDLLCTTTWTFEDVQMPANGQDVVLTAEFVASNNKPAPGNATAARTGSDCTFTSEVLMTAPASCSCVPPTFTACPTNKTAFTSANACTAVVDYVATAGGVPASVMTYALTGLTTGTGNGSGSGTTFNKGVTTVTLTATNDCGAPTCQFTVTVTDNVKPVITCPANRTVNVDQDLCSSVQTYDVTTTDNCSASTTQTSGLSSGTAFPVGVTTNGFTATDAAGNTSACAFTVTVIDNQKPVLTCPANRTVNADQGQCSSVQTYDVTTTDNCSATTQPTAGLSSGAAFPVGTTINAFLATDAAGNTAICSFSIRVLDAQLPTVACPANTTLGIGSNCSAPLGAYGLANKSDNCSTAIFETQSPVAGTIVTGHNTAQTVTLTATDASGNTASCSFVVTLKDVMAPSITCPANIIRPTDPNLCSAAVTYATPIYSDNCSGGGATHINGGISGSAFAKGTTTVNWQATDGVGLTKTCSFTITVNDAQAPAITCPANMVRNNDAGQCSAVVTYPTPKAADNCSLPVGQPQWVSGGTTPTASGANSIATFQKGANIVTWRATDGAGLTKTCTFRVTVNDTEAPTLTCPAAMSLTTAPNTCSSVAATYTNPTFTDNCALTNSTATRISGLVSGSTFPIGNSNVVFQATDAAGNTRRCTMVVTVTDNQPPVINCPASVVATGTGTPCRAIVFYGSTTASDNCAGTLTPFLVTGLASGSVFPIGVTTNTFRAVAPNGQSSECSFSVTVDCGSGMGNNGVEVRNTNLSIQHSDKLELKLAPNPALSTVTVSIEGVGAGGGTLLVFDAVGRLILRQVIAENQQTAVFQVDGAEFAPGLYRVNLRTEHGMVTKTLVVVK